MTKLVVFCIRRKFLFVLQLIFFENFLIKSRLWNCIKKKFFSSMCVCVCVCFFNIVIKENTKLNLALGKRNAVQSKLKLYVAQDVSFFFDMLFQTCPLLVCACCFAFARAMAVLQESSL